MGGRKDLITAGLTLGTLAGAAEKAKGKMSAIIATESGAVVSFTAADAAPVADLTAAIVPVQSGSGDPSPTNIRPISGWTECKVTRAGKNLIDADSITWTNGLRDDDGNITESGSHFTNAIYGIKPSTQYTISGTLASTGNYRIYFLTKNEEWIERTAQQNTASFTFVTPNNCGAIQVQVSVVITNLDDVQLELGSTATSYESYQGTTYPVSWQTEAGTVYGGTLDVTTGTLAVTMANIASYNGETLPGAWISDRDVYAEGTTPTIGAQVVYELATPIIYHLTPIEIQTLAGQNTIWADTGDVTVKYTADTKAFIDKYIAARRNG